MAENNLTTVSASIEFRDFAMKMDRQGKRIFAREHGSARVYEILPRHVDAFQKITLTSLFKGDWPPVYMEDFAQALPTMPDPDIQIDVFTN